MSFIDDLIAKGGDLFDDIPDPVATDAVISDRFDQFAWDHTKDASPALRQAIKESGKEHDYTEDLYRDVFNQAIKGDPQLREPGEMKPTHAPHVPMVDHFSQSKQMTELRQYTKGDRYASAMATVSMQDAINEAYERMEAAREAALVAAEARAAAAQAAADALAQALELNQDDPAAQEIAAELAAAMDAAQNAQSQAEQEAQSQAANAAQQSQNALDQAARKAAEERAEEDDLMRGFGVEDGVLKKMDFQERYELAKKLRGNRLAKFAKLIGQFRMFAAAETRRKVRHAPSEISGVVLGNDLTRLVPAELLNLATPETEDDFWQRYVENTLWQWELTGTEKLGRGPIIAVVDESGSMTCDDMGGGATREAWSKAFALALCDQARREKRDFHYIGFSSSRQVWHLPMPSGHASIAKVIQMTEHFWNGGTDYEAPLTKAVALVEDYGQRGLAKPDVVFITDDDYGSLDPDFMRRWNAAKEKLQMRCFGVGLHIRGRGSALTTVSDNVRLLADLAGNGPMAVADVFRTL